MSPFFNCTFLVRNIFKTKLSQLIFLILYHTDYQTFSGFPTYSKVSWVYTYCHNLMNDPSLLPIFPQYHHCYSPWFFHSSLHHSFPKKCPTKVIHTSKYGIFVQWLVHSIMFGFITSLTNSLLPFLLTWSSLTHRSVFPPFESFHSQISLLWNSER